jgi:hypothetical protein
VAGKKKKSQTIKLIHLIFASDLDCLTVIKALGGNVKALTANTHKPCRTQDGLLRFEGVEYKAFAKHFGYL